MKKEYILLYAALALTALGACTGGNPGDITNWIQSPSSTTAVEVRESFFFTLMLIMPFLLLAEGLLLFVMIRFRAKPGREPAKFHQNVKLELIWTITPALTFLIIALSTYKLIGRINYSPESDLQVEVTGQRFFWRYSYPEYGIAISDEPLVAPAEKVVTLLGTSVDVIHSWWVPALGVKKDVMPGRITEAWFKARAGTYKGQCAELCGPLHAEMLIDVKVVPVEEFEQWVKKKQAEQAMPGSKADSTDADSTNATGKP